MREGLRHHERRDCPPYVRKGLHHAERPAACDWLRDRNIEVQRALVSLAQRLRHARYDTDAKSLEGLWTRTFDFSSILQMRPGWEFCDRLSTDGLSVSVELSRPRDSLLNGEKKKSRKRARRGIWRAGVRRDPRVRPEPRHQLHRRVNAVEQKSHQGDPRGARGVSPQCAVRGDPSVTGVYQW